MDQIADHSFWSSKCVRNHINKFLIRLVLNLFRSNKIRKGDFGKQKWKKHERNKWKRREIEREWEIVFLNFSNFVNPFSFHFIILIFTWFCACSCIVREFINLFWTFTMRKTICLTVYGQLSFSASLLSISMKFPIRKFSFLHFTNCSTFNKK